MAEGAHKVYGDEVDRPVGHWNGPYEEYNTGRTLSGKGYYENGRKVGMWEYYYPELKILRLRGAYYNGKETGEWLWLHTDGSVVQQVNYLDGQKHGTQTSYHAGTRKLDTRTEFVHGLEVGECVSFYESGQMRGKCTYVNGKLDGETLWYFDEDEGGRNNIYQRNHWNNGLEDGLHETFYPDKSPAAIEGWHNGRRHGPEKWFDPDGTVTRDRYYEHGNIVIKSAY